MGSLEKGYLMKLRDTLWNINMTNMYHPNQQFGARNKNLQEGTVNFMGVKN